MAGYVKLYRKIIEWEWYSDINTKTVFLHCLLNANHREKKWRGEVIQAGEFITSREKLATELKLTIQQVRTSLERLKSTNEITIKTTSRYTRIGIVKWADYQGYDVEDNQQNNQPNNKQITSNQPANNQQITTTKNDKNEKNDKNKDLRIKDIAQVVSYLNQKTGSMFRVTASNSKFINARFEEGFKPDDFIKVIDNMTSLWKNDPKMSQYLRPQTLFGTKFDAYLNYKVKPSTNNPFLEMLIDEGEV